MQKLIRELHQQKPIVRYTLFVLSMFVVLSSAGVAWFSDFERDAYFALNDDPQDREEFIARQDERLPNPLAAVGKGLGSLTASIGSLIGFDREEGFDTQPQYDTVHLLPLSR